MSWRKSFPILTFLVISTCVCLAQNKSDSLESLLKTMPEDTIRVNSLIDISKSLYNTKPEEAIHYATQAHELAQRLKYPKGSGYALKNIGLAYFGQGKYPEALESWGESLETFKNSNDKLGEANILNNIATVYFVKGDYVRALDNFLRSLKLSEDLGDSLRIATAYLNIGAVYENNPTTYEKALQNYVLALEIGEKISASEVIGTASVNLGQLYLQHNKLTEALTYLKKSELVYRKIGDTPNFPFTLGLIGKVYSLQANFQEAIKYQDEAIEMANQYGYKIEIVRSLIHLGNTYKLMGRNDVAIQKYRDAEIIAVGIGAKFELKNIYEGLASTYSAKSDYKNAFLYQQNLASVKDSLFTDDNAKKLGLLQFEFDLEKKESKIALQGLELEKQKVTRNALILGIGFLVLLAFFLYRNYKVKSKSNKMLAAQNYEINQQKEEIEAQRDDIDEQRKEIENLMLNILPLEVAQELRKTGKATPQYYDSVTVLFTDFKEFTRMSEFMSAQDLVAELNECFIAFDEIIGEYGLEKIKTIGDAYMCACGIPTAVDDHPARTVRAALAIQKYIAEQNAKRASRGAQLWELRLGIHTGPVIAGVVGRKKFAYDIWGSTVNVANRLESGGEEGRVNISEATYQLIKDEFECRHRGKITAKSLGEVDMYFVERDLRA